MAACLRAPNISETASTMPPSCVGQEPRSTRSMSGSAHDVLDQSDLKKLKLEADGSFNRAPSTFRDTIQEGSKYEPEKGILSTAQH